MEEGKTRAMPLSHSLKKTICFPTRQDQIHESSGTIMFYQKLGLVFKGNRNSKVVDI